MSSDDTAIRVRQLEVTFRTLCDELRGQLLGIDGPQFVLVLERWQATSIASNPELEGFILNHVQTTKDALLKTPVQAGQVTNFGNVGGSVSVAGVQAQTVHNDASPSFTDPAADHDATRGESLVSRGCPASTRFVNWTVPTAVGIIAVWWWIPEQYALGWLRECVTVLASAAAATAAAMGWLRFRRKNWRAITCFSLAAPLAFRLAIPNIAAFVQGQGKSDEHGELLEAGAMLVPDDSLTLAVLVTALVVLVAIGVWAPVDASDR